MLVQFSVSNFLSFDEEQVFSMLATSSDGAHPEHVVEAPNGNAGILRAAALYGPNASGKSSLVRALTFLRDLIVNGVRAKQPTGAIPFKLNPESLVQPSKFEIIFRHSGIQYDYGIVLNRLRIFEEWLYSNDHKRERLMFRRTTAEDGQASLQFGKLLTEGGKQQRLGFIAEGTRAEQPFISQARDQKVLEVEPVIDWFTNTLVILAAESEVLELPAFVHYNKSVASFIATNIKAAGTGIEDIETDEIPFDVDKYFPRMPEPAKEDLRARVSALTEDDMLQVTGPDGKRALVVQQENGQPAALVIRFKHRGRSEAPVTFSFDEESDGTKRLMHVLPAVLLMKSANEKVVVVDELDRRFHPLLTRMVVELALRCDSEHTHSQLIFTTHDTNLLDLELLRRDEIWFVEKDNAGASNLYSLADFKVRPDLRIEKGYLQGRFGALPFISSVKDLGWCEDSELIPTAQPADAVGQV